MENKKHKILKYELLNDEEIKIVYESNKTIRVDKININKYNSKKEKIIEIRQVNENSIMLITSCNNKIYYEDIFIGNYYYNSKINKNYAGRLTKEEFLSGVCVHINDDHSAIAIFTLPNENKEQKIQSFYDFNEHNCGILDFLDCHYNRAFKSNTVNMEYVLIK